MADADRMILLNPGPVTLTDGVRNALHRGDWCHREPEFADLTRDINGRLVRVYREMAGKFDAVMLTGFRHECGGSDAGQFRACRCYDTGHCQRCLRRTHGKNPAGPQQAALCGEFRVGYAHGPRPGPRRTGYEAGDKQRWWPCITRRRPVG